MKYLILFLLIGTVSANTGYIPLTIMHLDNGKTGYDFCKIGEPCKYLNNTKPLETIQKPESKFNKIILPSLIIIVITLTLTTFVIYSFVKKYGLS